MRQYDKSITYIKGTKCCVEGCNNVADYEVVLYDYYPKLEESFCEQDYTCPFLCQFHMDENEKGRRGEIKPRQGVSYPYTNQHNAQGHSRYNLLTKVYPNLFFE